MHSEIAEKSTNRELELIIEFLSQRKLEAQADKEIFKQKSTQPNDATSLAMYGHYDGQVRALDMAIIFIKSRV